MERLSTILSIPMQKIQSILDSKKSPVFLDHYEVQDVIDVQDLLTRKEIYQLAASLGFKVILIVADQYAELEGHFDGDYLKVPVAAEVCMDVLATLPCELVQTTKYKLPNYYAMTLDIATRTSLNIVRDACAIVHADPEKLNSSHIYAVNMACADCIYFDASICLIRKNETDLPVLVNTYLDILRNDPVFPTTPKEAKFLDVVPDTICFAVTSSTETCDVKITDFDEKQMKLNAKIKKAYCAPQDVERNPVRDLLALLTFDQNENLTIHREEANGGDVTFNNIDDLNKAIVDGSLHPADMKAELKNLVFPELKKLNSICGDREVDIAVKSKKKREGFEVKTFKMSELFEKNYKTLF